MATSPPEPHHYVRVTSFEQVAENTTTTMLSTTSTFVSWLHPGMFARAFTPCNELCSLAGLLFVGVQWFIWSLERGYKRLEADQSDSKATTTSTYTVADSGRAGVGFVIATEAHRNPQKRLEEEACYAELEVATQPMCFYLTLEVLLTDQGDVDMA